MVNSAVFPDLERKPGGPDNWVERAGGLPSYIERIAKQLHYTKGKSISHAIAIAVNTVKRWAKGGTVTKYGTVKTITPATQALAAKAVAEWEAKKKAGSLNLSEALLAVIDLAEEPGDYAFDLLDLAEEKSHLKPQKCKYGPEAATKSILWAEGMAYIPVCDAHLAKGKSGVVNPMTDEADPNEIVGIYDLETKKRLDLADADISATSTMVALMIPDDLADDLAVDGGVPADDLHVTITFHGDLEDDKFNSLVDDLKAWAADIPSPLPLKGQIAGIGGFPDNGDGTPWFAPVDVPNLNTLHEQVRAVADRSAPASSDHGYSPHMTLTYGGEMPEMVEPTPVEFTSIWVVRGNTQRVEIPLQKSTGTETGADLSEHAILFAGKIDLTEGDVDIKVLAERANAIADPVARGRARAKVLDLASTIPPRGGAKGKASDGRPSFKRQGKWGHGFVPKDRAAKEAKAKGSPIAMNRMNRLFGGNKQSDNKPTRSKSVGLREKDVTKVSIGEKRAASGESAGDVANLRNTKFEDGADVRHSRGRTRMEASKEGRSESRATQSWDSIPERLKTVRNGKRYVVATFNGKQIITEWVGGINESSDSALKNRKVMRTLSTADAMAMSTAEIRAMLKNPNTPEAVKKVLNKALTAKTEEN